MTRMTEGQRRFCRRRSEQGASRAPGECSVAATHSNFSSYYASRSLP